MPALSRFLPDFQYSFVQFGPRLLDGDPAIGTAFLTAYLRATGAFVAGRTPSFVREFAESNQLDRETLAARCRKTASLDGVVDRASVQRYLDWLIRRGLVDAGSAASRLIDTRFVDAASPRLEGDE